MATAGIPGDGLGLSLHIRPRKDGSLSKTFQQRVRIEGKDYIIGLGRYPKVGLEQARAKAVENVRRVAAGGDPRKRSETMPTFAEASDAVIDILKGSWKPGGRTESA